MPAARFSTTPLAARIPLALMINKPAEPALKATHVAAGLNRTASIEQDAQKTRPHPEGSRTLAAAARIIAMNCFYGFSRRT